MPYNREETKKLFDSIDSASENSKQALEDFKQALQFADVNEFDMDGNTPLICVVNAIGYVRASNEYNISTGNTFDDKPLSSLKEMLTLLTQHKDIDINTQNKEQFCIRQPKIGGKGGSIFLHNGKEIIAEYKTLKNHGKLEWHYTYFDYNSGEEVIFEDELPKNKLRFSPFYDGVYEEERIFDSEGNPVYIGNTALHIAFMLGDEDAISILYTKPDIKDDIKNLEEATPKNIIPNKIKKLKDKIQRNLQRMDKSEKSDLEKTIKDLEEKKLRIESQITSIRADRKSSSDATVNDEEQNQNHKLSTGSSSQETQAENKHGYLIKTGNKIKNSSQTKNNTINPKYTAIGMGIVSMSFLAVGISTGALVNPWFLIIAGIGALVGGFAVYHGLKEIPSELSEPTSAEAKPALVKV
ncbi:ABC transporter permease [Wolbachia endosymbiont of Folsomia candida]|uniref:hypothetical protein n=1 Tax=Wolbachia endosymbiont of Folsomia candida TaxID=169402 RepID=UPI000A6772E8|nr:hypothetical protein [Wolbachia endosymbiont of Folsomia candida]APR98799.1 hypothetical protein ASM33_06245 [Wolbachia endosymbiont of Folsomia candida]